MTGSGMQQARDLRAEETVEVVQNHADGTGFRGWLLGTEARSDARGSGRSAAINRNALARGGVGGGEIGARYRVAAKAVVGSAPPDESHERRSRFDQGQQRELWRGAKTRGSVRRRFFRKGGSVPARCRRKTSKASAVTRKVTEGAGRPPACYDHAAVIFLSSGFGRRYCPAPEGRVNPMRASIGRPVSAGSARWKSRCPSIL
jgi:hypothetical protein